MSLAAGRPVILSLAIAVFFVFILTQSSLTWSPHHISRTDLSLPLPNLDFGPDRLHHDFYASDAARDFCRAHGYSVFQSKSPSGQRKVYDLFMVNTELDFLEIRLNTLYDYVDYFVIVEASRTFQGKPRRMLIKENWDSFKAFHDKMIYHELQYPKEFKATLTWDYETLQRNAMYDQVIPALKDKQAAVEGDVLIVADVDEIPRPSSLLVLRTCDFPRRLTLGSKFYYYSFQFLHNGREWAHPQATYYQGDDTILPDNLRAGDGGSWFFRRFETGRLDNAAWHCSSCFATIGQFLNKMGSFSHIWMNGKEFQDRDKIAAAVRDGRDLWGRMRDTFTRIDNNTDVPPFLSEHSEQYRYMLNRDGETAGFTDYP